MNFATAFYFRLFVLLSLFTLASSSLSAQSFHSGTIKGMINDQQGTGIPFASVFVRNAVDSVMAKSAMGNESGQFTVDGIREGLYVIEVKMMGFESFSLKGIRLDADHPMVDLGKVMLKPFSNILNGVTINAKLPFIDRQADKIVVNLNNGINAGSSLMEVMDKLPGVRVDAGEQISLNGAGVQIYIDGKLTPLSASALSSLLKGMSAENIQKIELIAHPSSKYDAAGSGGIINIVRKRNTKDGASGNVYGTLGKGKYGKQNGGLNLNFKGMKYNLLLNANYSYNKYYLDSKLVTDFYTDAQVLDRQSVAQISSIRKNRTFTPNLGLDLYLSKKTTLSLSVAQSMELFRKDAGTFTQDFNAAQLGTGNSDFRTEVKTRTNNFSSGMHLLHQIDTLGREYTIDADFFRYGNYTDQDNLDRLYTAGGGFLTNNHTLLNQDRTFNAYTVKADYTHPFKGGSKLEAGWKSSYVNSNNSNELTNQLMVAMLSVDRFRYAENINAIYSTYSKKYKKFSYQLGLRGESTWGRGEQPETGEITERNYFKLYPSAFFDYKLNDKHAFNLTVNKRIERPNYENLNPLIRIVNANNYTQGNPYLQPIIAYHAALTYSFQNALSFRVRYTLNQHDFTSISTAYNDEGITIVKPVNNSHSQAYWFDMGYTKQVLPCWFISTGVSLSQQSFKSTISGFGLNRDGLLAMNVDSYHSFGLPRKLFLDVMYRYSGKTQLRNTTNFENSYLTAGFRKVFNKGSLSFNVTDIFNSFTNKYLQNSELIRQLWDNNYESRVYRLSFTYNFGGNIKRTKTSNAAESEKSRTSIKAN
jgi:hypothetical protein